MEPKDIDKLFGERLKHATPTPPGNLWNRLQERIETEMPAPAKAEQLKEEPKPIRMWRSYYSLAAAIALLLASGIIFYKLRSEQPVAQQVVAQTETAEPAPQPAIPEQKTLAAATTATTEVKVVTEAPDKLAAPVTRPSAPAKSKAKAAPRATADQQVSETPSRPVTPAPARALATHSPTLEAAQPAADAILKTVTPVALAPAQGTAQPVEIIIKRSSAPQDAATEDAEEELSGFEKKQRLVKGIFRQARNLTNGERIDLSDLGINADRIALETQIGKHKISKVITL